MKKIIALALVLLSLIPYAFAESIDYSSMTADQLREVIVQARAALACQEEPFTGKCVVYDENDIKVTITGVSPEEYTNWVNIQVTVVNKSDRKITVMFDDIYINGWQINIGTFSISEVEAKKNAKGKLTFLSLEEEAEVTAMEEIEDFAFKVKIYDPVNYKTLYATDEQTITFSW